jgi:hypothetical protein
MNTNDVRHPTNKSGLAMEFLELSCITENLLGAAWNLLPDEMTTLFAQNMLGDALEKIEKISEDFPEHFEACDEVYCLWSTFVAKKELERCKK